MGTTLAAFDGAARPAGDHRMSQSTYRLALLMLLASALATLAMAFDRPWAGLVAQGIATLLGVALVVTLHAALRDARWDGWLPAPRDH